MSLETSPLTIADRTFDSRLFLGTGKFASPESMREFLDEYIATGANYFVCSFQWGDLSHQQAMRSIELFTKEVMPHYVDAPAP